MIWYICYSLPSNKEVEYTVSGPGKIELAIFTTSDIKVAALLMTYLVQHLRCMDIYSVDVYWLSGNFCETLKTACLSLIYKLRLQLMIIFIVCGYVDNFLIEMINRLVYKMSKNGERSPSVSPNARDDVLSSFVSSTTQIYSVTCHGAVKKLEHIHFYKAEIQEFWPLYKKNCWNWFIVYLNSRWSSIIFLVLLVSGLESASWLFMHQDLHFIMH